MILMKLMTDLFHHSFFTFVVGGSGEHKYDRSCPKLESSVHAMYCWMGKNVIIPWLHSFKTMYHIM